MGYNLLDERTEVNGDVSVDEELSKNSGNIEENNPLNVYDESYNNYDIIANNENDLGDKKSADLQSDIDVNMQKNDEIGEGFDGDLGGDFDDDGDWDDEEELDENDPDYDWEHINFLKELKKSLDAIDERDAKELEERHKNGGLLDSQLVNYDDYEYEDFSEYDHLSNEEIDKMCGDMSDLDWDAIEEFWKTHKRGAPHILIDPVTREEIGTIYDTPSEEEEEEEEVVEKNITMANELFVRRYNPRTANFNEVYGPIYERGKMIEKGTEGYEGEYSNDPMDSGGETKFGVTKDALKEYNTNFSPSYKTGKNFPSDVKKLTKIQAKTILNEMFFRRYNINYIENKKLARIVFDTCMNAGTELNKVFVELVEDMVGEKYKYIDGRKKIDKTQIHPQAAMDVYKLSDDKVRILADNFLQKRMEHHLKSVDRTPIKVRFIYGWYDRTREQYSNPKLFEKKYRSIVIDCIRKYFNYLSKEDKVIYRKKYLK